ncbi:MAG: hypothetical protein M1839_007957 [Geoglossum umbratile]|nr:MAG: hypothetical protein M1839_007957 [Geoglossum umbratile]
MASTSDDNSKNGSAVHSATHSIKAFAPATMALHADDPCNVVTDVAPPLHVSTTFRYPKEMEKWATAEECGHNEPSGSHVYSRIVGPTSARLEVILSVLLKGRALTYSSGLAALHSALVFLNPKRISIGEGYHGCHGVIGLLSKLTSLQKLPLSCPAEDLHPGDVIHLETPLNPTGEALSIAYYAEKAHSRGAYLIVDATFGPPGLQDPFLWGADIVMHSGTKYLGGHSDMLCGVLAVKREEWYKGLFEERIYLGNMIGNLEGWLGIRSLKTLELRVQRQSASAGKLVAWLHDRLSASHSDSPVTTLIQSTTSNLTHASLQLYTWLSAQMPNGHGPVFAIYMRSEKLARALPGQLRLFQHATSLGGVESLIEWRAMSDPEADGKLLRISVGLEEWKDLRDDLLDGLRGVLERAVEDTTGELEGL